MTANTAHPILAEEIGWIPLRGGLSFRPLHFTTQGYALQLKVEPGTLVPRHRHTGEVHAYNLSGSRRIIDTGEVVGPGTYVYEPPGNIDSWACEGDEPCIIQISLTGKLEYLDENGGVVSETDSGTAYAHYCAWCALQGREPDPALIHGEI